ncbi:MAG: hypothetical protein KAS32_05670 [Candidatus Peribacteraceae bacterium]|nr:hypothetical protein [Candidatus Peribacteraceae bacterium]
MPNEDEYPELKLEIGAEYYCSDDLRRYTVAAQDNMCYYLCIFNGSCSKVIDVSKACEPTDFTRRFKRSRTDALIVKIDISEKKHRLLVARLTGNLKKIP